MMAPDRTVPLLLTVEELRALVASVSVMRAAGLENKHARRGLSAHQAQRAREVLEGLERHLSATLDAVPVPEGRQ